MREHHRFHDHLDLSSPTRQLQSVDARLPRWRVYLRLSMMQPTICGEGWRLQALRRRLGPSLRVEPQATHRLKHHQASQAYSGYAFSSNLSRQRSHTTHFQCMQTVHTHDGIEHKHPLYPGTVSVSRTIWLVDHPQGHTNHRLHMGQTWPTQPRRTASLGFCSEVIVPCTRNPGTMKRPFFWALACAFLIRAALFISIRAIGYMQALYL